jgi:hypothetical protein
MASAKCDLPVPLHPDVGVLDEPDRTWFGILSRQAIRRGSFRSAKELIAMIAAFTAQWNEGSTPLHWVKTADQILGKAVRKPSAIGESGH